MTPERRRELETKDEALTQAEMEAGYHFCPDWDFKVIGPEDPEIEGCICDRWTDN